MRKLDARTIYCTIKSGFNRPSWLSIAHNAKVLFSLTDHIDNIENFSHSVYEAIQSIDNQMGPLDGEKIATFAIFFLVPQIQDHITAAINTRLATNPHLKIHAGDLLDMILQIKTALQSFDHSKNVARINASFRGHNKQKDGNKGQSTSAPRPRRSANSAKKEVKDFDLTKACFYCGELGHWVPNCQVQMKALKICAQNTPSNASVASYNAGPSLESLEALLDSRATHSVVGNISLFTNMIQADMTLSVASNKKCQVAGIRQIRLKIGKGILTINNVLYCKAIPGIILSIGQIIDQLIKITFCKNQFIIQQAGINFYSYKRDASWFLHIKNDSYDINIKPLDAVNSSTVTSKDNDLVSQDMSSLWHQQMGHLSDIGVCHPCSISKSEHWPVKNGSRGIVEKPGDVIVVDLIGPLPESLNNMKYILMIQDVFSKVVVALPIADKSEAKFKLQHWMNKFINITNNKIKILQSDNRTEFKNHTLEQFLGSKGIIHEFAMPYEHHQNGRIEWMNQTICEMLRTMLHASRLPPFLWPWAYQHCEP
ncbi:hypothetical protein O181_108906 [Austropuccinia psidii MF-1]|uniref:Integrase catalytic domain-containing protein n=1 Tax=Austropuccinia psidii MF-1 TaxID=1389203 RepID=A0A9Q3JVP2_9BASI|nr:hypothetical protein [Austropuccinia psidii MF-1]